jgi:CubicO group peptidase (beta-lactamase class C family)
MSRATMAARRTVLAAIFTIFGSGAAMAQIRTDTISLDKELAPYLERYKLPAVAAAVVKDGRIVAAGVAGTRRIGTATPVMLQDKFHIGSDTKAMTSLLAAILIEHPKTGDRVKLGWKTTVGEVYPELLDKMAAGVKDVTLEQLLSHTSGIPGDREEHIPLLNYSVADDRANLDGMRAGLVARLVTMALTAPSGQRFEYANMGYVLAGAMLEKLAGKTWEELVAEHIFEPLRMASAGFGPQSSMGRVDAPLGHAPDKNGQVRAYLAGPWGDNPAILGPAGTAHMSVLDFATWAAWNAMEGRNGPQLVKPETIRKMHTKVIDMPPKPDAPVGTPSSGGYGLGWGTVALPFTPDPFVFHGGSNNMNLAYILMQPQKQFGMVLMTNISGQPADNALKAMAEMLYKRFGQSP